MELLNVKGWTATPVGGEISSTRAALRSALCPVSDGIDNAPYHLDPYLDYIESSWPGRGSKQAYLRFFTDVVGQFSRPATNTPHAMTIQQYIDTLVAHAGHYYFPDTSPRSLARATSVKENVLLVLGTWLLLQSYFIPTRRDQRCVVLAFCLRQKKPYAEPEALGRSLADLVAQSELLPNAYERGALDDDDLTTPFQLHSSSGLIESLSINPRRLNAVRLSTLGRVEFIWTTNISRHLLLSRQGERHCLELFGLPCALQGGTDNLLAKMDILAPDLIDEIEASYAALFSPVKASHLHDILAKILALRWWCWCLHCSSRRLRRQILAPLKTSTDKSSTSYPFKLDPRLKTLMQTEATEWRWDRTEFKQLWPRILALDAHLEQAKPWSFWVIFRDRRDTVQYWTFL
jgi:hypothetical protein